MEMDNIIKNPTFIAFICGITAYSYVVWRKNNNKRNKKNKNKNKNSDNNEILVAGIVFAISWLITYGYINYSNEKLNPNNQLNQLNQLNPNNQLNQLNQNQINPNNIALPPQRIPTYKLVRDISESPKSFTLMNQNGGITMPLAQTQIPDIFIA
jgi:hypothetical protein